LTISVLNPIATFSDDINQNSIVLKMTYGSVSFMFIGDANADAESHIANSESNLPADILNVGHHGSATSSSSAFFSKAQPKTSVIEVGAGNFYGHPTSATHMSPGPGGICCVSH
jgi:beta-lactamase superfamily II metal-dependent hydrolase